MRVGIGLVAAAAAVMSFAALAGLAYRAGMPGWLAWMFPVAVDAAAAVATSAWLVGREPVRRYARGLALSAAGLSVAGNAGELAMSAYRLVTPWWVVVLVSAVPPVMLAATVHLAVLTGAGGDRRERPVSVAPERAVPAPADQPVPVLPAPEPVTVPVPARRRGPQPERSDAELVTALRGMPQPVSINAARRRLGVGTGRATRLLKELKQPAPVGVGANEGNEE